MEKNNTDYKRRTGNIQAKLFNAETMDLLHLIIQYILESFRVRQKRISLDIQLKTALSKGSVVHHQY